jgi:hypothetical protein
LEPLQHEFPQEFEIEHAKLTEQIKEMGGSQNNGENSGIK